METIPTPRTDGGRRTAGDCDSSTFVVSDLLSSQIERELHIAKQALERIINEGDDFNSDRAASALCIAEGALKSINTLSA